MSLNSVLPTSSSLQCLASLLSVSGDNGRLTRPVSKSKENVHDDLYETSTIIIARDQTLPIIIQHVY